MFEALEDAVLRQAKPFFGICVGMQLMAGRGLEHGDHQGFGWVPGTVQALTPADRTLKIPHMGWNELQLCGVHPLFAGLPPEGHAYFVHSYHFVAKNPSQVLAAVEYGGTVTAAIGRDNMVGTQFHPEKSQAVGLRVISNFLKWNP